MSTPLAIVMYLLLFFGAAVAFLFVNLLVGKFLRPKLPNEEKLEIYECGEPTIGSSFVQFDLRFYVVALLFIIFDVEVAFFFPWATVFGKATQLASPNMPVVAVDADGAAGDATALAPQTVMRLKELGVREPSATPLSAERARELGVTGDASTLTREAVRDVGRQLAVTSLFDIGVFFGVLMVGFAYVWKRGDLDWVRAMQSSATAKVERTQQPLELSVRESRGAGSILSA